MAFEGGPCTAPRLMTCLIVADTGLAGKAAVFVHFCRFSVHSPSIASLLSLQATGCLVATLSKTQCCRQLSNKGISVSCIKVRLVVRLKADSRASLYSTQITLLQPLDHVFKPPQHRLRNSLAEAWSKACQTSVNYALVYSRSGILTTMLCLAASRSSHTAT